MGWRHETDESFVAAVSFWPFRAESLICNGDKVVRFRYELGIAESPSCRGNPTHKPLLFASRIDIHRMNFTAP